MLLVERERHAPVERGAADGEILETALHEANDLVSARLGLDEIGMSLEEVEQRLLEGRELEEPALLLDALERAIAIRAERVLGIRRGSPAATRSSSWWRTWVSVKYVSSGRQYQPS